MAIYHCSIKIISRAGGRSAVASAAYRSGEKLYNEETGLIHDFTKKGGVVFCEIILPKNAPDKYMDRQTLWNDVQQIEKRCDARFAREVEVALPVEMTREQQIKCVRNYIRENFISKGMIADWALHDKDDGNPHAHIMLTVRGFDKNQEWATKTKSVFANDRDEQGRAIYNPDKPSYDPKDKEHTSQYRIPQLDKNGEQKFRERPGKGKEYLWERINIQSNDWNDRDNAEIWRESWAINCNQFLDKEHQIDHRSYERQGIDKEPTIHEGITARKIASEGKIANRMQINREIRERNSIREQIKQLAKKITQAITEKARMLYERFTGFTRSFGNSEEARRNDGFAGTAADRDRTDGDREPKIDGTSRRINDIKRDSDNAAEEIQQTEQNIESTSQRINELQELVIRKERERNERIAKLRARRTAGHVRTDAGRDRAEGPAYIQPAESTETDIQKLIRNIRSEISAERSEERKQEKIREDSEIRADNSSTQRKDRESEQQRLAAERSEKIKERGRDHGFSL